MRLPNHKNAFIDTYKLRAYILNNNHPIGKYKARVFQSALAITSSDIALLKSKILMGISEAEAEEGKTDQYGKRYYVDVLIRNLHYEAVVRTAWIILMDENFPRLTSCYVKK